MFEVLVPSPQSTTSGPDDSDDDLYLVDEKGVQAKIRRFIVLAQLERCFIAMSVHIVALS